MKTKTLKIGFDLDGVILYNPIRCLRPIAKTLKFIKPFIFHQEKGPFYFPKTNLEKFLWKLLHKSSFKENHGLEELRKLVKKGKIEAYLITARYSFLEDDYFFWLKKIKAKEIFHGGCYFNKNNLQPNEFKEKIIKKLKLDIFVEDNWDIIKKLNGALPQTKIFWITNWVDQKISYSYKFSSLKQVIRFLQTVKKAA